MALSDVLLLEDVNTAIDYRRDQYECHVDRFQLFYVLILRHG